MQGVVAFAGQTSPPDANCSTASPTPYWKYSVLLGGGRCDSWADARFARPAERTARPSQSQNGAAFLRRALLRMKPAAFVVEAGSTFVVVTGLTVPESFV